MASVEAARASDALEALEAILPAAAEQLMALAAEHAAAGAKSGFAARQLLAVAARCVDLSDATARKAAADLVQVLAHHKSCFNAQLLRLSMREIIGFSLHDLPWGSSCQITPGLNLHETYAWGTCLFLAYAATRSVPVLVMQAVELYREGWIVSTRSSWPLP